MGWILGIAATAALLVIGGAVLACVAGYRGGEVRMEEAVRWLEMSAGKGNQYAQYQCASADRRILSQGAAPYCQCVQAHPGSAGTISGEGKESVPVADAEASPGA